MDYTEQLLDVWRGDKEDPEINFLLNQAVLKELHKTHKPQIPTGPNSMRIIWKNQKSVPTPVYFSDLELNDTFRLTTGQAIYVKVLISPKVVGNRDEEYAMLELATGKVFKPSSSPVEYVDVEVNVGVSKPNLY